MKKLFIYVMTIGSFCLLLESMTIMPQNIRQQSSVLVNCSAVYKVRCIKFTAKGTATNHGTFDSDAMTLTINNRSPYRVSKNPRYGDGTKCGEYYYTAGDYYFNID